MKKMKTLNGYEIVDEVAREMAGKAGSGCNPAELPLDETAAGDPFFLVEREGQVSRLSMHLLVEYLKENGLGGNPTFTIAGIGTYEFEQGMTWDDWCYSAYNTEGWWWEDSMQGQYIAISADDCIFITPEAQIVSDTYYPEPIPSKLQTFYVEGFGILNFDPGMTWGVWINSEFNTEGFGIEEIDNRTYVRTGETDGVKYGFEIEDTTVSITASESDVDGYTPVPINIKFTLSHHGTFEFDLNMTWDEWVNSAYSNWDFGIVDYEGHRVLKSYSEYGYIIDDIDGPELGAVYSSDITIPTE